ncbi:MAG: phosphoglucosamine mutase [Elusimicrobiales bacterium]
MGEHFGTDGIRGIPGKFPLVEDFVVRLGREAARAVGGKNGGSVIIARDTRLSGEKLRDWLARGMRAAGFEPLDTGIAPTPAVSYLVPQEKAAFGAVISASHNPPEFNGIKFFSAAGVKLDETAENAIEAAIAAGGEAAPDDKAANLKLPGRLTVPKPDYVRDYENFIVETAGVRLDGMKIVVDCANGAAYDIAPRAFERLGARVTAINCSADGEKINRNCGALHPQTMCAKTAALGADCGFSLDGDADRVIFSDETGAVLDGDDIIAMAALELKKEGRLKHDKVALTVMSNLGIVNGLKKLGVSCELTQVGDKYISQAMEKEGLSLGGEASGHIIFRDFLPTGDGLLSAVQAIALLKRSGMKMSDYGRLLPKYPQLLKAVTVKEKIPLENVAGFDEMLRKQERTLSGGRIVVRYSGTEPKLRVLVEGPDRAAVERACESILDFYTARAA